MRNLIMALAAVFVLCSGFTSDRENVVEEEKFDSFSINEQFPIISVRREIKIETLSDDEIVRCRVRTCYYQGQELINCTNWVDTYCDKDENGNLTEHFSQPAIIING